MIDHRGGRLTIDGTDTSLKIPPGALVVGQEVQFTISVHWGCSNQPALGSNQIPIGPFVHCEPEGIQFSRPVTLTIPQSSANANEEHIKIFTKTSKLIPLTWLITIRPK